MLTTSLRGLERDGFITRTIYPTVPPKVEYQLTELGRELAIPVRASGESAMQNRARVLAARERVRPHRGGFVRYDARVGAASRPMKATSACHLHADSVLASLPPSASRIRSLLKIF